LVHVRLPPSPPSSAFAADGGIKIQGGAVGPGGWHWLPVPPHTSDPIVVETDRACPLASRIETDTPRLSEHGAAASFQML
jgi:hypothetical protein